MHRLRRFAALLVTLLLVQLTLAGAGAACAVPTSDAAPGHAASAAPDEHAQHAAHAGATHEAPAEGEAPARHHDGTLHCPTMMACAIAAVASSAALPDRGRLVEAEIAAPDGVAPASVIGAPEPPPPRG